MRAGDGVKEKQLKESSCGERRGLKERLMRIQATREWKSHRITLNSAIPGEIKVTASVIHPSRPIQLKGNSCPPLQVGGGSLGGEIVCVCGGGVFVYQVFMFSAFEGHLWGVLGPAPCSPDPLRPSRSPPADWFSEATLTSVLSFCVSSSALRDVLVHNTKITGLIKHKLKWSSFSTPLRSSL